ncbi:OLC1v1016923C1 [Oldenlandia corymbosa var. corymbosa]|uniref:OLC1v1016923C1 n=1 Tax=Oldenlandia corymbosa var. corymbosa TaxID=529605 RepID=A0AAV1E894_OLDCO|nr:OLC1v1016923C1 [Oldenlandia corymbosa var. corymbosa]
MPNPVFGSITRGKEKKTHPVSERVIWRETDSSSSSEEGENRRLKEQESAAEAKREDTWREQGHRRRVRLQEYKKHNTKLVILNGGEELPEHNLLHRSGFGYHIECILKNGDNEYVLMIAKTSKDLNLPGKFMLNQWSEKSEFYGIKCLVDVASIDESCLDFGLLFDNDAGLLAILNARTLGCAKDICVPADKEKKGITALAFTFKHGLIVAADHPRGSVDNLIKLSDCLVVIVSGEIARGGGGISVDEATTRVVSTLSSSNVTKDSEGLPIGVLIAGWDKGVPVLYHVNGKGEVLQGNGFAVGSSHDLAFGFMQLWCAPFPCACFEFDMIS